MNLYGKNHNLNFIGLLICKIFTYWYWHKDIRRWYWRL